MTLFSKIIRGEVPSFKLKEDDRFYAFLDIQPLRAGHTLVIPKTETDRLFDLGEEYLRELLVFAQPLALAIERAFPCRRVGLSVIGLEVPHAHLHLVPLDAADDLNFTRPKLRPTQEELHDAQQRILKELISLS